MINDTIDRNYTCITYHVYDEMPLEPVKSTATRPAIMPTRLTSSVPGPTFEHRNTDIKRDSVRF